MIAEFPMVFHLGMRLDHLSYAAPIEHLAETVQRLGATLGAVFMDGGLHPRFGTRNFVLPLAGGTYIEAVSALDHPAAEAAPFGRAVRRRADAGGGWMGWVVAVSDLAAVERRLGRPAAQGHRIRPDGFDLRWRQIGVLDTMRDPQLPYFIHWDVDRAHHPSDGGRGVSIARLEIAGDADTVSQWLGEPANHPLDEVDVDWIDPDVEERPIVSAEDIGLAANPRHAGLVAVHFLTQHGVVRID